MLNLRFIRLLWASLAVVGLVLAILLLIEYQSLKAQTVLLSQLQTQYQNLNQQLSSAITRQNMRTRLAEKKSGYSN